MEDKSTDKKIKELENDLEYLKEMHDLTTNQNVKELWEEDIKQVQRQLNALKKDSDEET